MHNMQQVLIFGAISGFSLLLGALTGIYFKFSKKVIAAFMAFGSGVLVCALTFGLMENAFNHGGFDAVIIGFLLGGATFILGDYLIHSYGGRYKQKHYKNAKEKTNGAAIAFGAILDGIPESIALGIALFSSQGIGFLILGAIVLSNFPEGISSISGLIKEGFNKSKIIILWLIVSLICFLVVLASYYFLHNLNPNNIGILEAFAAGAILAMLADSMMPEAFEEGGYSIGLMTILGFLTSFIFSRFK